MPVLREGGILRGPGVFDMKGGLVLMLAALQALQALQLKPALSPVVLINSDEEIGSPESTRWIKRLAQAVERVWILEPAYGPAGKLKTARKGVMRFDITVQGKSAHAGLAPDEGISAILELAYVVQKLAALNDPEHGVTVNVGVVSGGTRPNVVAAESRAEVDVRVPTAEDAQRCGRGDPRLAAHAGRSQPIDPDGSGLAATGAYTAQSAVVAGGAASRPAARHGSGGRRRGRRL